MPETNTDSGKAGVAGAGTSMTLTRLASGAANARTSRATPSNLPAVTVPRFSAPEGRASAHVRTPGANWYPTRNEPLTRSTITASGRESPSRSAVRWNSAGVALVKPCAATHGPSAARTMPGTIGGSPRKIRFNAFILIEIHSCSVAPAPPRPAPSAPFVSIRASHSRPFVPLQSTFTASTGTSSCELPVAANRAST